MMTSRLELAQERLDKALTRVAAAVARENVDDETNAELEELAKAHAQLRERHAEIAVRLDSTIDRMRRALEPGS